VARKAAALVAGLLVVVLLALPVEAGPEQTRSRLQAARARLHELNDRIAVHEASIANLQGQAAELSKRINLVLGRIADTQARIIEVKREIDDAQAQLQATQAQLDERARAVYETGPGSNLEFLLGSQSLADFTARLEIVDRAAESDRDLITRIQGLEAKLVERQGRLRGLESDLRETRDGLNADYRDLQAKLQAAQQFRDQLQLDRAELASFIQQLDRQLQREIRAEQRRLERLRQQQIGGGGEVIGGVLQVCPVDPPRSYADDFGYPRPGGRTHQGNDIFAPYGTPIRAPFPGTAVDSTNALGGLAVKVYGSQGFVYNAHLSRFGKLGPVSTGDIIGYVGDSGNAQGTAPHDHFEWHPGNGPAVDPYPYLNSVCR
jgi:peptidoglycan hydrolase CwlO-like protein